MAIRRRVRSAWLMGMSVACALLSGLPTSSMVEARRPKAEPYFGHVGEACAVPDTTPGRGMIFPGVAEASPPEPRRENLVMAFLAAASRADGEGVRRTLAPGAMSDGIIQSCVSAVRLLTESCRAEPPYVLGDREIRISWVCGDMVPYAHFFTITGGLISNIWASDSTDPVPVMPSPPRDRTE